VDKDNNEIFLKGVKFQVIDDKGNILETIVTDENGEATTAEYPIRDFENLSLKEIETLAEYKLNDNIIKVKLKANETVLEKVENEVKKGQIKVIKVDKDNNEIKLEGVIFEILNEQGEVVQTIVTDKNGEATTKELPINEHYILIEKETQKGYKLNNEEIKIELAEGEISSIEFENSKEKGKIKIVKTSSDGIVEGFTFKITGMSATGEKIEMTVTTGKDGIILIDDVLVGEYTIEEIRDERYEKTEPQTVQIKDGETAEVNFYNKLIEVNIPKTGDTRNQTALKIVLGIASALLLSIVIYEKLKK